MANLNQMIDYENGAMDAAEDTSLGKCVGSYSLTGFHQING